MRRELIHSMVFFTLFTLINGIVAHHDPDRVCSVKQPTSSQVCISVKFPWKENPVFFCTDYTKINYTPQCIDPNQSHHCYDDGRNDTLKIATPWDCCPLISTPNRCSNVECPPEPFNRTCKVIKILGACCPTYFCDAGEPDNCKTHRLKPDCVNPPKNKTKCIAFRDHFGCCNKYQCDGEAKLGFCPSRIRQNRQVKVEEKGAFGKAMDVFVTGAKDTMNKVATTVKGTLEKHGGSVGKAVSEYIPIPFKRPVQVHKVVLMRCAGDHTCPGTMKCCPRLAIERSIARHKVHQEKVNGVRRTTTHTLRADYYRPNQRNNLVDGVCVEPELEGTIYHETTPSPTRSDKDYISTSTPPATKAFSSSSSTQNIPQDLSTTPNQVTETISQSNPTITVTSESPTLSPTIPTVSHAPTTASASTAPTIPPVPTMASTTPTIPPSPTMASTTPTSPPTTTPAFEESTTEPPTAPSTSATTPTVSSSSPPPPTTPRQSSSESSEDDKNTIVHE